MKISNEAEILKKLIRWGDQQLKENPHNVLTFGYAIDKAEEFYRELKKKQKTLARGKNPKKQKNL